MKNSMQLAVALALGAIGTTAAAQTSISNVTLYGRINSTVERQKIEPQSGSSETVTGLVNNASRWGIRGTEDLGGGMTALFQLESGFGSDTGQLTNNPSTTGATTGLFNREAFVGLSSSFGTIRAGRITSPLYFATADYISMHNHDTGTSSDTLFNFNATGVNNNNTLAYKTPDFSGGSVEVAYSFAAGFFPTNPAAFQERPGSDNQTNLQVAINWVGGPLHLGGGYAQMKDKSGTPQTDTDMWVVRALYEIGSFTLGAYYETSNFTVGTVEADRGNFRLAAMYTMGASEFHLNYGMADDLSSINDSSANQWTLAYNYNLSKRTKVYAFYTQVDQDANVDYFGTGLGSKFSSFALGLRHNF